VATELTSTTITNILEAVPGIKNVLRSPAADAMVNLAKAAAGIGAFDIKDARELLRFAFRRGLINNEEHDRVLAEVEVAAQARQDRLAARRAARDDRGHAHHKPSHGGAAAHARRTHGGPKHHVVRKAAVRAKPKKAGTRKPARGAHAKARAGKGGKRH